MRAFVAGPSVRAFGPGSSPRCVSSSDGIPTKSSIFSSARIALRTSSTLFLGMETPLIGTRRFSSLPHQALEDRWRAFLRRLDLLDERQFIAVWVRLECMKDRPGVFVFRHVDEHSDPLRMRELPTCCDSSVCHGSHQICNPPAPTM